MVSEHFPTEGCVNASYTEEVRRVREALILHLCRLMLIQQIQR